MDIVISALIIGAFLWLSFKVLKFLFILSKKIIGWVGPYIVAAVPAAGAYIATTVIFAAIIGTVMQGA